MINYQKLFIECDQFMKLANAVCSKCGDDNPYLDNNDPNFLCRQCRTRAQAWGGDDKKEEPKPQSSNQTTGYAALKSLADDLNDDIDKALALRRYHSRQRAPFKQWAWGAKEGYVPLYVDYSIISNQEVPIAFREIVDNLLNVQLGTAINDRVESDGRCVAYWNIGGDIDEEADYGKAMRVRLLTQPTALYDHLIRLIVLIPTKV